MKVKPEHYEYMRDAMALALDSLSSEHVSRFRANFSEKRFRWDLARGANLIRFMTCYLYEYCNDTHIDTALRAIIRELDNR